MVLTKYPAAIVEWATDPRTGIQATEQFKSFPPNSGEVKAFCDAEVRRIHEAGKQAFRFHRREYVPPDLSPGCRANLLVHSAVTMFPELKTWTESPKADPLDWKHDEEGRGIWVNLLVWQHMTTGQLRGSWKRPTLDEQYAAVGQAEADYQRAQKAP